MQLEGNTALGANINWFQSSTGSVAGCNTRSSAWWPPSCGFNPQPALWPDATINRVGSGAFLKGFQSSTGSVAGCNLLPALLQSIASCGFNPQPALWPDATCCLPCCKALLPAVSILNRLCGRMQLEMFKERLLAVEVSILNRLCGRMQHAWTGPRNSLTGFQSSTGSVAGCNSANLCPRGGQPLLFQSSTGSVAGCNPGPAGLNDTATTGFNPQPALWPDATCSVVGRLPTVTSFNPQPALWPDATISHICLQSQNVPCFNPQPALWPDATIIGGGLCKVCGVSILNRLCGRMQPEDTEAVVHRSTVSILNRLCGRMQLVNVGLHCSYHGRFNPQPALWPDATDQELGLVATLLRFQSSTGSVAGCNPGMR